METSKTLLLLSKILATLSLIGLLWGAAICLTILEPWTYQTYLPELSASDPCKLGEDRILQNYQAMVTYGLKPGFEWELEFQGLPMSAQGRQHFAEVRAVFQLILKTTLVCLPVCLLTLGYLRRQKIQSPLLWGPMVALLFPALIGLVMLADFSRAFTLFHQLVFRNDYWIFDPAKDPIIEYLPQEFFESMAFVILLVLLALCLVCLGLYFSYKRRKAQVPDHQK